MKQQLIELKNNIEKIMPFDYKGYWKKRYDKYGHSILYCGNKGLSKEENIREHKKNEGFLMNLITQYGITKESNVLDVGCGIGLYAKHFYNKGFKNYKGIDYSGTIVNKLKQELKDFNFEQKDLFKEKIEGKYDFIIMIDVTQHIIKDSHLKFVMDNIQNSLNKDGLFFVTDFENKLARDSYYIKRRPLGYYKKSLNELTFIEMYDFGGKKLFIFKK